MFVLMLSIIAFAICLGVIQGTFDPESQRSGWYLGTTLFHEMNCAIHTGFVLGALTGIPIEIIRQLETKHRKPYRETQADSTNLNFDTDSEGSFNDHDFGGLSRNSPRGNGFASLPQDDEESESLVIV